MTIENLILPRWVYVPGRGGEPDRETLERVKATVPARFDAAVPETHPALRYGLALNDAGFFWECHEILEAIWTIAPQGGRDRILLRACIQIANANLKQTMGQPRAALRLYAEALADLNELRVRQADPEGFATNFETSALAAALRAKITGDSNDLPIRLLTQKT